MNPLRWMKGPKVTPYSRLPKRIDRAHMEAMWREAANRRGEYSAHLWVTVLAMLYGTGLRRGELERLDLDAFDRTRRDTAHRWSQDRAGALRSVAADGVAMPGGVSATTAQPCSSEPGCWVSALCCEPQRRAPDAARRSATASSASRAARGCRSISLHQFRHSCASDLLESGVHLAQVQRILGHRRDSHHGALYAHRRSAASRGDDAAIPSTIGLPATEAA